MSKSKSPNACSVCGNPKSPFFLSNKAVCLKCDHMLFDIEIECENDTQMEEKTNFGITETIPNPNPMNLPLKK